MRKLLLTIGVTFALSVGAQADILYDNLAAAPSGFVDSVQFFGPLYDSFSTGSSSEALTGLSLLLEADNPSDGGSFEVGLYADSSTSPGGLIQDLGTVSDSALTTSLATYTVNLAATPMLSADTRYWIGLTDSTGTADWSWSTDISGTGVASEYFANSHGVFPNGDGPYQMQVSASAVPEPSTFLGLAGALGALGALKLRRKSNS